MYDVVLWHVIFGSGHNKNMVSVNASVEARSALIPPIMGFDVVQSIELPYYYLFHLRWQVLFKITNVEIYTFSHEY